MRENIAYQLPLCPVPQKHKQVEIYKTIDEIINNNRDIIRKVEKALTQKNRRTDTGRKALPPDLVLRAAIIKQMKGMSYRNLAFSIVDSMILNSFCRIGYLRDKLGKSSLQKAIWQLDDSVWQEILKIIVKVAVQSGMDNGRKMRIDTTVTSTNIHHPSDSTLLFDVVKSVTRLFIEAFDRWAIPFRKCPVS